MNDKMVFYEAKSEPAATLSTADWKILIVDDEPHIHSVTRLALKSLRFAGRKLQLLSAHSGREAVDIMRQQPDVAVVLMDV